jgi:uncharacterized phage-associated protein
MTREYATARSFSEHLFAKLLLVVRRKSVMARPRRKREHDRAVDLWVEADEDKLAELILYVAGAIEDDPTGGATKLNKILYFSEFRYIRAHGRPITGASYQKLENGPAPTRLIPVRDRLIENGDAELFINTYFGRAQQRLKPLRPADRERFDETELTAVDRVVKDLWGMSAKEASDLSHQDKAWQIVRSQEEIPFSTAFLAQRTVVTEKSRNHARELAEKLGIVG